MVKYLFAVSIIVYIVSNFIALPYVDDLVSVLALACVLATVLRVQRFAQMLGLIFLLSGLWMLWSSQAAGSQYLHSFGNMLNLLSLFALVPILALPMRLGNYAASVQDLIQKRIRTSSQLYRVTSGFSYFLSSFMNVATLPMMYYAIRSSVDLYPITDRVRFMCRAITRGFCMPLLWAPVTPIVGIVVEMNGVDWGSMLRYMIPLSVSGLMLDWVISSVVAAREKRRREANMSSPVTAETMSELAPAEAKADGGRQGKLHHIVIAILFINLFIWIGEKFFDMEFLLIVSLLVIPVSLVWCLLIGTGKQFVHGLKNHLDTHIDKMKDQFFIFLSAGFFLSAIQVSGIDDQINAVLLAVKDVLGQNLFIVLIPLIPFLLAFWGIHPVVALALVAQAINPQALAIDPEILTIAMLGGAVPAFMMGPYNATLGIMSNIANVSNFRLTVWNTPFSLFYLLMIMSVLVLLELVR